MLDGEEVELSAREFRLAEIFLRNVGQVLSREQLLDQVWGYDFDPGSNVVDVYVGYLRRKLGAAAISTVRGVGYRFEAPRPQAGAQRRALNPASASLGGSRASAGSSPSASSCGSGRSAGSGSRQASTTFATSGATFSGSP